MSAHREREAVTDQLIRAALRQQDAGTPDGAWPSCPDPELLAAFVERRLAPDEVGALEGHLADCARCQETLATLVRALPVLQGEPERRWDVSGWLSSPWRWAVPATIVAALVAVWSANRQPAPIRPQPESTVAEVLRPAEGVVPEMADERPPNEKRPPALRSRAPADAEGRGAVPSTTEPAGGQAMRIGGEKAEAPATEPARQLRETFERVERMDTTRDKGGRAAASETTDAPAPPPAAPPAPEPAAPAAAAAAVVAERVEPDVAAPAEQLRVAERPRPDGKTAASPPLPTRRAQETGRRALAPRASEIVAADGTARWRFGFGGTLFKSADGITWERQQTGTTLDLLSGSAPTSSVCWVVGREGLVLVTDDGEHWRRLPFPEAVDLVHIEARDARSAIVTTADDRRFETTDAGQAWLLR